MCNKLMSSAIHRALIFQGGGSLGAYEAGAYKDIKEDLLPYLRSEGKKENEPFFHIISGTSIGSINAAILVSYVKENKTWEGSGERLVEFWEYLSTSSSVESMPYFSQFWDYWNRIDRRIASGESARRYYSTKEFIFKGVPNVFVPKIPMPDTRFFDPLNTWYIYDNKPLKESLEKFAKFPISTSFENGEPRLLLIAVDVQEGVPVVFDSYEKEDGIRKSVDGEHGELEFDAQLDNQSSSSNKWENFKRIIRYEDGIKSDFVLASCSVPANYDYARLNVEDPKLATGASNHGTNMDKVGSDRSSQSSYSRSNYNCSSLRFFWDGGLLANTPLRETITWPSGDREAACQR
jgi:NTE family protein